MMNETVILQCSDDLAKLIEDLRTAQKGFFAAPPSSLERTRFLQESKRLESIIDKFIEDRKSPQQSLF